MFILNLFADKSKLLHTVVQRSEGVGGGFFSLKKSGASHVVSNY